MVWCLGPLPPEPPGRAHITVRYALAWGYTDFYKGLGSLYASGGLGSP